MKKITLLTMSIGLMSVLLLIACGGKKNADNETIMAIDYTPPVITDPIAMDSVTDSRTVVWMNGGYRVTVQRVPLKSLPMVSNDYGQKYVDNRVSITIRRPDGSEFFSQAFTKSAFNAFLDADYRENGLLADIHFDKAVGEQLEFTVSVAHALLIDSEEMLLKLIIDNKKNVKVDFDDNYDIVSELEDYEIEE